MKLERRDKVIKDNEIEYVGYSIEEAYRFISTYFHGGRVMTFLFV